MQSLGKLTIQTRNNGKFLQKQLKSEIYEQIQQQNGGAKVRINEIENRAKENIEFEQQKEVTVKKL